ncbi:MAG: hypothetical protein ACUZ8O_13455 [Candidatus Anammoxibacter sp.]
MIKKKYKSGSRHQFWQEGSHPQLIEDVVVLKQKVEYMHMNPVKRGLVRLPEHWFYSSAANESKMEYAFVVDEIEF